jgi:hypothetical protein
MSSGDFTGRNRLFITNDTSLNGNLFIGGVNTIHAWDSSFNGRLYVGNDSSLNSNVYVGKDLTVNGNLKVKQYSTNLTVYTVSYEFIVAEDMSLNGRLYAYGDASFNARLYTVGDVSFGGNGYFGGNVGIGSGAPGYKLDVNGTGRFSSTLTASNGLTLTAGTLSLPASSVTNAMLANSSTTLNGQAMSLGSTYTIPNSSVTNAMLANSATTLNGQAMSLGSTYTIPNSSVTNAMLANSAMTIAGTSVSLGGSIAQSTICSGYAPTANATLTGTTTFPGSTVVNSSGWVGSGITSPLAPLDVGMSSGSLIGAIFRGVALDAPAKTLLLSVGANSASLPPASGGGTLYFYYYQGTSWGGPIMWRTTLAASQYFTGQHGNYTINQDLKTNLVNYVGLLVSSADEGYYSTNQNTREVTTGKDAIQITEALPKVILTTIDKDPAVWGVVSNVKNDDINPDGTIPTDDNPEFASRLNEHTIRINGLGEGALWVTNINGNIKNGDWICSSIVPGYGRKQDDDLFHNYTAAKATMSCNFDINNDNLYKCKEVEFNGTTYLAAFIGVSYHCS